jgi:hypothetical protein
MTDARVRRGRDSEDLSADYLLPLFPDAVAVGNSLPGRDILNTPGIAAEVKARRRFEPLKAMRQAVKNAGDDMPMVILRCQGQGEASIGDWLVFFRFEDVRELLGRAFNLGEYSRTADESSSEELGEDSQEGIGDRLESLSYHPGNAMVKGGVSFLLRDLGVQSGDWEISIRHVPSEPPQAG